MDFVEHSSEKRDLISLDSRVSNEIKVDFTNEFTIHQMFNSREDLTTWVHETGKRNGLVIVIQSSAAGGYSGKRPRITLCCERSGYYRIKPNNLSSKTQGKRKKETGTKKCGCPFQLKGKELPTNEWVLEVKCGLHNHPAAKYLEGHSYAGRLSAVEKELVADLTNTLVRPKDILGTIKQKDELNVSTLRTIYNARQKHRLLERAGRTQMQQLMLRLSEHNYIEFHRICDDGVTVNDLFWAHPTSVDLLQTFPSVLIMDCTYKTNRYRLPLFEIVGVTSTLMTFSIAFVYLQSEREESYAWALGKLKTLVDVDHLPTVIVTDRELALMTAIKHIFPTARHLLCRWHINRNVLAKCKKMFDSKEKWKSFENSWTLVYMSDTEEVFNRNLELLNKDFSTYSSVLNYVRDVWLTPYKCRFVGVWVDTCMHYGNTTSNRAESAHSKLKNFLGSSQCNFEVSWNKIHMMIEMQHTDIKASFEKSLTVVPHTFKPTIFKELRGVVSIAALNIIHQQMGHAENIGNDASSCKCVIRCTHGLPCAHEIAEYIMIGRPIPLECVDFHWRKLSIEVMSSEITEGIREPTVTCKNVLDLISRHLEDLDPLAQKILCEKIIELARPQTTNLVEPVVKLNNRGRPKLKIDTSTTRNLSAFEYAQLSQQDSNSPCDSTPRLPDKKQKISKLSVRKNRSAQAIQLMSYSTFINEIPMPIQPCISQFKDVEADGNCGFRAIASLLDMGENAWGEVRLSMAQELIRNASHYIALFGNYEQYFDIYNAINYHKPCPTFKYWMRMPDMGHVIASCFGVVLVHLSKQQCLTFLPLRTPPQANGFRREIAIAFVNGNHFVQVFMHPNHPIPPVALQWHKHHDACAEPWIEAYTMRIQQFRDLVGDTVATTDIIGLE